MPRRGSRAQLVHLLADDYASSYRHVYGNWDARAYDFYEDFRRFSYDELAEMAATVEPRRRGRPSWQSNRLKHFDLVNEISSRLDHLSERSACEIVARNWGINPRALRMQYRRRAQKR